LIHRRYSQPFGSDEIRDVIENVTGLAVERRADGVEGAESHALDLAGFLVTDIPTRSDNSVNVILRLTSMTSRFIWILINLGT
jgi:hypothetical protein